MRADRTIDVTRSTGVTAPPIVVLDTSVVLGAGLIELLVALQARSGVRLKWSEAIRVEIENKLPVRPTAVQQRCLDAISTVPDPLIKVRADDLEAATGVFDPLDRHVLGAALAARRIVTETNDDGRVVLLTRNLRDFDVVHAATLALEIVEPDPFIAGLIEEQPEAFAFIDHVPEERFARYIQRLQRDGMDLTAASLQDLHAVSQGFDADG